MNNIIRTSLSKTLIAVAIASATSVAQASGFALIEQSASGQGAAYAGAAAVAEDASTIYFNPAGMTRLSGQQIVVAGHIVAPNADYTDKGSQIVIDAAGNTAPLSGTNSSTSETGIIPNFYYSAELENEVYVGVGVNVPFGLATDYDNGWYGRYHAMKSAITSVNINPSIAWNATDKVSVGFGVSIQYIDLELTNNIESNGACANIANNFGVPIANCAGITGDSASKLTGDSTELGWNAGILIDLDEKSRLGIAYRSSIKHDVSGNAEYNLDPVLAGVAGAVSIPNSPYNILQNTSLEATAALPETFSVSFAGDVSKEWTVLADWTWTGWSSLDEIVIRQSGGVPGQEPTLDLQYKNANRYSIGAHYKPEGKFIYRGGLAYDESAIRSKTTITPRVPGNDRTWLSLGIGYTPAESWSLDFGYSHLFISTTEIQNGPSASSSGAILIGEYESSVDILSAQATFNF